MVRPSSRLSRSSSCEEQGLGLLREGHRDPGALALAAGEGIQGTLGEIQDARDL
jgi:hypothetical protein